MINLEKFICSLLAEHPKGVTVRTDIHKALKEQGLEYKGGKIVSIKDKTELKESEEKKPNGVIVQEDFNEGDGFYKVNLAYLSKEQVEEIETIVKEWNHKPLESDDENIRKWIRKEFESKYVVDNIVNNKMANKALAWLEKQANQKPIERKEFTSIPFGAFDSELYEQMLTIPDGCAATIEGNKIHIKKKDKSAIDAIKLNHIVDNNEMVKSNFKAGDWVVRTNGENFCNGSKSAQIQSIELDGEMCYLDTGRWLYPSEMRLWTIYDAQDGDLIYVSTEEKSLGAIFDKFDNGIIYFHCYICGDFTQGGYMSMNNVELIYPWQKEHHQKFFQKMKEAGYEWDSEKKELIKIEQV